MNNYFFHIDHMMSHVLKHTTRWNTITYACGKNCDRMGKVGDFSVKVC